MANIGASTAGIGGQLANMGVQRSGLGELTSKLNTNDLNTLMTLGGQQQQQQNNILAAQRSNEVNAQNYPYTQYSFLSDIYRNNPGPVSSVQTTNTPNTSAFQTIAGLGIKQAGGLFG